MKYFAISHSDSCNKYYNIYIYIAFTLYVNANCFFKQCTIQSK